MATKDDGVRVVVELLRDEFTETKDKKTITPIKVDITSNEEASM